MLPILGKLAGRGLLPASRLLVHPISKALLEKEGIGHSPLAVEGCGDNVTAAAWEKWLRTNGITHVFCTSSSRFRDLSNAELLVAARNAGIPSLGCFDHWKGFDRFGADGNPVYCPDRICCIDKIAAEGLRKAGIPGDRIAIVGHPYLEILVKRRPIAINKEGCANVLLISQPRTGDQSFESIFFLKLDKGRWIDDIASQIKGLEAETGASVQVTLRAHPKEINPEVLPGSIRWDNSSDMEDAMDTYDLFVGKNSMALIEAACAGKACICLDIREPDFFDDPLPFDFSHRAHCPQTLAEQLKVLIGAGHTRPGEEKIDTRFLEGSCRRLDRLLASFLS